jgi:hypothetical protein
VIVPMITETITGKIDVLAVGHHHPRLRHR